MYENTRIYENRATICPPPPGDFQVRIHPPHSDQSRTSDLAAVAQVATDPSQYVLVACASTHRSNMVSTIGLGWRQPNLKVVRATSLIEVTAAYYRAIIDAAGRPITLILDDWTGIDKDLFADRSRHNEIGGAWIRAIRAHDLDALHEITGLDATKLITVPDEPVPALTLVIAATFAGFGDRPERSTAADYCAVRGFDGTLDYTGTIVSLEDISVGAEPGTTTARLRPVKDRHYLAPAPYNTWETVLTRPIDSRAPWTPARQNQPA